MHCYSLFHCLFVFWLIATQNLRGNRVCVSYHEKQIASYFFLTNYKSDLWIRAQPLTSHQPGIASLTGSALRFSETCSSHLADIGVFVASTQLQSLHPSFLLTSRPQPAIISLSSSLRFTKVSFNIPTLNKCFKKKKERKKHPHRHAASNSCEVFLHLGNRLRAGNRIFVLKSHQPTTHLLE